MTKLQRQVTNNYTAEHPPFATRGASTRLTESSVVERQVYHVVRIGLDAFWFYASCPARSVDDRLALRKRCEQTRTFSILETRNTHIYFFIVRVEQLDDVRLHRAVAWT